MTVGVAGLVLAGLGTAVSAYGQVQAGKAQEAQANYQAGVANYNAAVARNNAILAERAATDARKQGDIASGNQDLATRQLIGRQRAVLAANGVQVDTGSAVDITAGTEGIGKLDALTLRSNAERTALNYEAQGMNFNANAQLQDANANLYRISGQNAVSGSYTAAAGTLLTGFGSVAQKWYNMGTVSPGGGRPWLVPPGETIYSGPSTPYAE